MEGYLRPCPQIHLVTEPASELLSSEESSVATLLGFDFFVVLDLRVLRLGAVRLIRGYYLT